MNNERIITSGQLFVLLFICKISNIFLFPGVFSGEGSVWELFFPFIIFTVFSFLLLIPIIKYRDYTINNKNIRNDKLMKYGGLLYILYFIYLSVYHLFCLNGFIGELSGTGIEKYSIIFFILAVSVYASYKGLEASARFSAVAFAGIVISALLMIFLLAPSFDTENLMPISNIGTKSLYGNMLIMLSQTEETAILFVLCRTAKGKFTKTSVIWNMFTYIFLGAMLILICGTLGVYLTDMPFPFYHIIDGSGDLQRFNPFFIGTAAASFCCLLSSELYIIFRLIGNFSAEKKVINSVYIPILAIIYGVLIFLCNNGYIGDMIFDRRITAALAVVFSFIIPLGAAVVYKIKSPKSVKRALRTASVILCISLVIPTISGCSAAQLNQRLIVQGIGIDKNGSDYTMTYIVLDTEAEEENSVRLLYSEGENVRKAIENLENQKGRSILLSQCLFIMVNPAAADNLESSLSYFRHNNDIMKTTNIIAADNSKETIDNAITKLGYTSENINLLYDSNAVDQSSIHFSLFDYVSCLNNKYNDMLIPYIETNNTLKLIKTSGSYLVRSDMRNSAKLNMDATSGILIMSEKADELRGDISYDSISYGISSCKTQTGAVLENGRLTVNFDTDIILDSEYEDKEYMQIYDDIGNKLNSAIQLSLHRCGGDVISLYKYIRTVYPDKKINLDDWHELLQTSKCSFNINIKGLDKSR